MRRVLAAATAALLVAGCSSGGTTATRPAWCSQAQHLNQTLAEPQQVQNAILLMTAMSLPGQPGTFTALLAFEKTQNRHGGVSSGARLAVREGTAAAVILRRDCG